MRGRRTARPQRRGSGSAAIAPESEGEMDGEQEEVAGNLTGGSFWAGKAGGGSSTERRSSGVELQWWTAFCKLDSVEVGHGRICGGMDELRGEVAQLRARGNGRGGEGWSAQTSTASSARPSSA